MAGKDVLFLEENEVRELLRGFEDVWRRVRPETEPPNRAAERAAEAPELHRGAARTPKWFVVF